MPPPIFDAHALILEMAAVWRFVIHLCTSEQAETIVQDAYMRAFDTLDDVPNAFRRSPRLWLFRIACEILGQTERSPPTPPDSVVAIPPPTGDSIDEKLQAAVCGMPMPDRMVFLLSVVEQLRYDDIAVVLNTDVETVVARLHEAHRFLRGPPEPPASSDPSQS